MAYTLGFGKYNGKTLEWLFFNDPGYVWWMIDKGADGNLGGPHGLGSTSWSGGRGI